HGTRELEGLGLEADTADWAHCRLSPDGKTLAVSYSNIRGDPCLSPAVLLWDWTTGKKTGKLDLKDKETVPGWCPAAFTADGKWFATVVTAVPEPAAADDTPRGRAPVAKRLRLWSVADRKIVRDWPVPDAHLTFLQFGPDGK